MNKIIEKIVAVVLVIVLAGANLSILGMYGITYALTDAELSGQATSTGNSNVEFNAYFQGGSHIEKNKYDQITKLYINIKVKNTGYLKNAQISLEDVNYDIAGNIENSYIQDIDTENNIITLKQINSGSDVTIEVPIGLNSSKTVEVGYFAKETKAVFKGTYVDGSGKERDVANEIVNKLMWERGESIDNTLSIEGDKTLYCYTYKEASKIITQIKLTTKYGKLPIKESRLEVIIPELGGEKAERVTVVAKTNGTNGDIYGINFGEANYTYTKEENKVNITTKNGENEVKWIEDGTDEYVITCIYEGEGIKNIIDTQSNYKYKYTASVEVEEYDILKTTTSQGKTITEERVNNEIQEKGLIGMTVISDESISKGQIYANYDAEKKEETKYKEEILVQVYDVKDETREKIEITEEDSEVIIKEGEGETRQKAGFINVSKVKVNKETFDKILGEEGIIEIYEKESGKIKGRITKETAQDEDGNYVLNISGEDTKEIILKIYTKSEDGETQIGANKEGTLKIEIEKAIQGETEYTKDVMKKINGIYAKVKSKSVYKNGEEQGEEGYYIMPMNETNSTVEMTISKEELTAAQKNENVEIRVTLDTSSTKNALFTNPKIKIKFPKDVEKIDIKSSNILMSNGLKINKVEVVEEDGSKEIQVEIEGKQTEYTIDANYKGTIIIITADITVEKLAGSKDELIEMEYINENDTAKIKAGKEDEYIRIEGERGIITATEIENYAEGKDKITVIKDESESAKIEAYGKERNAKISGIIVNNTKNKIKNVRIIGRIPAKGNKKIDNDEDLGSTFTTTLETEIGVKVEADTSYKIYYSEKADATSDLGKAENGWKTEISENAKSYLIELEGKEIEEGEKIEFNYEIKIPEKLEHNQEAYAMYKVTYKSEGEQEESKETGKIGIKTGEGANLKAEIKAILPEGATVREGQTVKMQLEIRNEGTATVKNVHGTIELDKYENVFMNYKEILGFEEEEESIEFNIGNLEGKASGKYTYWVKVKSSNQSEGIKALIQSDGTEGSIPTEKYKFNVENGKIEMNLASNIEEETVISGKKLLYTLNIQNKIQDNLNNIVINVKIPEGLKYDSGYMISYITDKEKVTDGISYDQNNNILTIKIDSLGMLNSKIIKFELEIEKTVNNGLMYATAKADGVEEHYSNIVSVNAEIPNIEISELVSTPKYVKECENIVYTLKITNKGQSSVYDPRITGTLPSELKFKDSVCTYKEGDLKTTAIQDGKIDLILKSLSAGESVEIKITTKAKLLENKNDIEIKTKFIVGANGLDEISTNTVTNVIEYNDDLHTNNSTSNNSGNNSNSNSGNNSGNTTGGSSSSTNTTEKRYKITGTAWEDSNKNGKREEGETLLSGIKVMLLNKEDNSIVKDVEKNTEKIATTNISGKYEFNNLPNGEYIVVFLYESGKYSLTEYRAKDVDSSVNSDVIDINITVDGKRTIAGTTDVITISNDNVRDIDMGVYTSEKFDLKLEKYVSKITLTTPTIGTKTYTYENSQIGKIEVLGSSLGKSNAIIEYKIVITNEGSVAGYAKKVVDYLPQGVGFNTELNKDWYLSENGNIYNTSLEETKINPGESKELTIVVTKKITEDSLGLISNSAEIYESYNEKGMKDIDSTEGNKVTDEDDISNAEVVVSIVTGKIITYTTIALGIITLLGIGIYEIKTRVLRRNKR